MLTPLWLLQDKAHVAPATQIVFMKLITVLLADDHMVVREGFRKLLEAEARSRGGWRSANRSPGGGINPKASSGGSRDGHCDASTQWIGSHAADPQGLSG